MTATTYIFSVSGGTETSGTKQRSPRSTFRPLFFQNERNRNTMETTIRANPLRLLSLLALAITLIVTPAPAQQKPWENDDCRDFAGCKLCEWEDCEVIDCRDDEGAGHVHMDCTGEPN